MRQTKTMLCLALSIAAATGGCQPARPVAEPVLPPPPAWLDRYPHVELSNGQTRAWVALPDPARGYNRASRFDRGGMVVWAGTVTGHAYFGPITDAAAHDPAADDHVAGTAGEFGIRSPPGFDSAQVGEPFVKIGVGALQRTDDTPYFFRNPYPLLDPGAWHIERTPASVRMAHSLSTPTGWAYRYQTTVTLSDDGPGFVIHRSLTNLGPRRIVTSHYSHNFVLLDDTPVGPGSRIWFEQPHEDESEPKLSGAASWDGRGLQVTEPVRDRVVMLRLRPVAPGSQPRSDTDPWRAHLDQAGTGARLSIEQSPRPDRVVVYIKAPYLSVEPFIHLDLGPGDNASWQTRYRLD